MIRSPFLLLPFLLVICTYASADEKAPSYSPNDPVGRVLNAYQAQDDLTLKMLAERDEPDPWLIAHALRLAGRHDVARAFARASRRSDLARLPAYLDAQGTKQPHPNVQAALRKAHSARTPEEGKAVLALLDAERAKGDPLEQVLVETERGNALSKLGRHEEAAEAFLAAGQRAERLGWLAAAAKNYMASGHASRRTQHLSRMIDVWTRLIAVQQARGRASGEAEAWMLVGNSYSELGEYDQGFRRLYEAERIYEKLDNARKLAWVLSNIGLLYYRRGEYARALTTYERALKLARTAGHKRRTAHVLSGMAGVLKSLKDHEAALRTYYQALELFEGLKSERGIAECTGNIGITLASMERYEDALTHIQRAYEIYKGLGHKPMICTALTNLGWLHERWGKLEEARKYLDDAVAMATEMDDPWLKASALDNLAEVQLRQGELAAGRRSAEQTITLGTRLASSRLLLSGEESLAQILLAEKKYARAVEASRRAMKAAGSLLSGLSHSTGALARSRLDELHAVAMEAALAWDRPSALFAVLEQGRAGALLEDLEVREKVRTAKIPEPLRKAREAAQLEARDALMRYRDAVARGKSRRIRARRKELEDAQAHHHGIIERIQRDAKASASLLYPEPATLEDMQAHLQSGETFVAYGIAPKQLVALVVTRDDARIVHLGAPDAIETQARLEMEANDPETGRRLGRLAATLIEPLELAKDTKRLLVSPVGSLGYVPFSALTDVPEVTYVPSATSYDVMRAVERAPGVGVLALGNPDYGRPQAGHGKAVRRGGMRLVPLPASGAEAKSVGDTVLVGKEATEAGFAQALATKARWRAVHFACHGLVDSEKPMLSALALSQDGEHDGLLTCADLCQMRVPADLAVLSACETAKGRIYSSEGIVGLTQAFMLAGAPRVLVSLWKVDDEATRALMEAFYARWNPKGGQGLSPAAALRAAQEHVRKQTKWKHPYYWAAWVLWGLPD